METEITVSHAAAITVLGVLRRAIQETRNFPDDDMDDETLLAHCQEFIDALDDADRIVIAPAQEVGPTT